MVGQIIFICCFLIGSIAIWASPLPPLSKSPQLDPSQIELSCPSGTTPLFPIGQTFNAVTKKYRQWLCVDSAGTTYFSGGVVSSGLSFSTASGGPAISLVGNSLTLSTFGGQNVIVSNAISGAAGTNSFPGYAFTGALSTGMSLVGGNINFDVANASPTMVITGSAVNITGGLSSGTYSTAFNCSSSGSPAVCSSAASGSVVIAAGATTVQVNTSAVGANSQITVTEDDSLGTKLSVTCNTTSLGATKISARTPGSNFTISTAVAPVTNPSCLSYSIIN